MHVLSTDDLEDLWDGLEESEDADERLEVLRELVEVPTAAPTGHVIVEVRAAKRTVLVRTCVAPLPEHVVEDLDALDLRRGPEAAKLGPLWERVAPRLEALGLVEGAPERASGVSVIYRR